ncbi:Phospholipase D beta 1, variant 2, partial [Lathyrus oleraceus]
PFQGIFFFDCPFLHMHQWSNFYEPCLHIHLHINLHLQLLLIHMNHIHQISNEEKQLEFHAHSSNSSFSGFEHSYSEVGDSSKLSPYSASSDDSLHSQSLKSFPVQDKIFLLHGNLDICIHGAKNLPYMDMFHKTVGDMFDKFPGNVSNKIEGTTSRKITSGPYVSILLSNAIVGRTFMISNRENPVWEQHFYIPVAPIMLLKCILLLRIVVWLACNLLVLW